MIPIIAMIVNSIVTWYGKPKDIRIMAICLIPLWLTYDYIVGSIAGMTTDIFILSSAIIGILRFDLKKTSVNTSEKIL
jgi:hypothetical protein